MTVWRQTGIAEVIPASALPPVDQLRVIGIDTGEIEFIRTGDFDGFVYAVYVAFGDALEWMRYPAQLIGEPEPLPADYADSAE